MVALASLWLPILLSAIGVFVVSSIVHMVLPIHRGDYRQLPSETDTLTKENNTMLKTLLALVQKILEKLTSIFK